MEYANNLGLDISQFLQNISKKVYIDRINEDIKSGLSSGVMATPTLFIDRIPYSVGVARRRHRWNIEQLMAASYYYCKSLIFLIFNHTTKIIAYYASN